MDSKVWVFFVTAGPTFLILVASACFAAAAAKRRKEGSIWLLFVGFVLQIAGAICSQVALVSMSLSPGTRSKAELTSLSLVLGAGKAIALLGGVVGLIGWILFATKRAIPAVPKLPNKAPEPTPTSVTPPANLP